MATLARVAPPATQIVLLEDAQEMHPSSSLQLVIILPAILLAQRGVTAFNVTLVLFAMRFVGCINLSRMTVSLELRMCGKQPQVLKVCSLSHDITVHGNWVYGYHEVVSRWELSPERLFITFLSLCLNSGRFYWKFTSHLPFYSFHFISRIPACSTINIPAQLWLWLYKLQPLKPKCCSLQATSPFRSRGSPGTCRRILACRALDLLFISQLELLFFFFFSVFLYFIPFSHCTSWESQNVIPLRNAELA